MTHQDQSLLDSVISAIEARDMVRWRTLLERDADQVISLSDHAYAPLHHMCAKGWLEGIVALSEKPGFGSALHLYDELSHTPLITAIRYHHDQVAQALIDLGADVNQHQEDRIGTNPLLEAAEQKNWKLSYHLISRGADPTIKGWMNQTAAQVIADRVPDNMRHQNTKKQIEWLIDNSK